MVRENGFLQNMSVVESLADDVCDSAATYCLRAGYGVTWSMNITELRLFVAVLGGFGRHSETLCGNSEGFGGLLGSSEAGTVTLCGGDDDLE